MLRLSKKVEYAIIALQYMAASETGLVAAKEMADAMNISFEFLSKTLQTLMKHDIIISHQGIRGGYSLKKNSSEITLAEVISALDDNTAIVECMVLDTDETCGRLDDCTIRMPMSGIQKKINMIFNTTTISELSGNGSKSQIKRGFDNE